MRKLAIEGYFKSNMQNFIIKNAVVLAEDRVEMRPGHTALAISCGTIVALGPAAEVCTSYPDFEEVDASGQMLIPGFVNAHTHTVLTALKGTVEDWSGEAIYRYMTPVSYAMTEQERSVIARLGCVEAIRSGTTTLVDPFRHVSTYAHAMAETGLRLWLSEACADIDTRRIRHGDYSVDPVFGNQFLQRSRDMIETFHDSYDGRVKCQVAAHAPDNCSPKMLHALLALADEYGLSRTIHLSQSLGEESAVQRLYGTSSTEYLQREGFLGPDLLAAHLTFCKPGDIEILGKTGVHMAHTPASISRRGAHRALLGLIRDVGVPIALGTDNMSEDMFQAMAFGSILHRTGRGREVEGGVSPTPGEILLSATQYGADALGASDSIGSLKAGKKADITFLDLSTAALRPALNIISNIVHYGHPGAVRSVMVDGQYLMKDRVLMTMDESLVIDEAENAIKAVWRRMVRSNPDIAPPLDSLPWLLQND